MASYHYTRDKLTSGDNIGVWDINNPNRGTLLATEIETALPGKTFKVICNNSDAEIDFYEITLTTEEETILTTVVNNHKNNL